MFERQSIRVLIAAAILFNGASCRHRTAPPDPIKDRFIAADKLNGEERNTVLLPFLRATTGNERYFQIAAVSFLDPPATGEVLDALIDIELRRDSGIFDSVFARDTSREMLVRSGPPAVERLLERLPAVNAQDRIRAGTTLVALISSDGVRARLPAPVLTSVLDQTRFVRCAENYCLERVASPVYPPHARAAQITGAVSVEFSIRDGAASEIQASGHEALVASAIETLKGCRFEDLPASAGRRHLMTISFEDEITPHTLSEFHDRAAGDFLLPGRIRAVFPVLTIF